MMVEFPNIPKNEQSLKWFLLLEPLILARSSKPKPKESKLLDVLNGGQNWKHIKALIEIALKTCVNAEKILSRKSQINKDSDPDGIINDLFAELKAIPYLICKGFSEIIYNKVNNVDFTATFNGEKYGIEVTYVRGPSFKTQKTAFKNSIGPSFKTKEPALKNPISPVYRLDSKKLISRFKTKYQEKNKQILKHGYNSSNAIILIISDLDETHEHCLNHDLIEGKHPIDYFVSNTIIPTVVLGNGSLYEPHQKPFNQLQPFTWENYEKLISDNYRKQNEFIRCC